MSKHLKMIVSKDDGPRIEETLDSGESYGKLKGFKVWSALYGDGESRYDDVTPLAQRWVSIGWPENWEELVYGNKPQVGISVGAGISSAVADVGDSGGSGIGMDRNLLSSSLKIHSAMYGVSTPEFADMMEVTDRLQSLVQNNSLDLVVNNSTITPNQNPYRGKLKTLKVTYSYDGGEPVTVERKEKEWLIIGQASRYVKLDSPTLTVSEIVPTPSDVTLTVKTAAEVVPPRQLMTAPALNDHLIRKFRIPAQRLRGPMPIEIRDFHRDDLAVLFAELDFRYGAEIGVAEGKYSEVLALEWEQESELESVSVWA